MIIRTIKILAVLIISLVAVLFLNFFLNITLHNPAFIIPLYGWADSHHFLGLYDKLMTAVGLGKSNDPYPLISVGKLESNIYREPRAAIIGIAETIVKASDGDYHVNIRDDQGRALVTEIAPDHPLPLPKIGQKIRIWGVTRYDLDHRWWEIHPVMGWEVAK